MALWTTAEVAAELKMSEDWVRSHAIELGAIRVGESKHSQLRFESSGIREWKRRRRLSASSPTTARTTQGRRRQRRPSSADSVLNLPIRGG
jgi:hypothetical protein